MSNDNFEEINFNGMEKTDLEFLFEFTGAESYFSSTDIRIFYPHHHILCHDRPGYKDFIWNLDRRIKSLIDKSSTHEHVNVVTIKKLTRAIRLLDYEIILDAYTEGENTYSLAFSQNALNIQSPKRYKDLFVLAFKLKIDVTPENHGFGYHIHHLQNHVRTNIIFTYKKDTPCSKKKTLYIEPHADGKCIASNLSINSSEDIKKAAFRACGYAGKNIACEDFKQAGDKSEILWQLP
jgi:hypothetical protein